MTRDLLPWPVVCLVILILVAASPTASAEPPRKQKAEGGEWIRVFDGKTLKQWETAKGIDYERTGSVVVRDECLVLGTGSPATGLRWLGTFPKVDFEIALEARRIKGGDFFCGMSFPVGDGSLTLILGGWGGWVVGLSCLDEQRAIDNETCQVIEFENDRWYRVRVQVAKAKVSVWIDDEQKIDVDTKERKCSVTSEMEPCLPFGFATWYTTGELRNIRYRPLR